MRLSTTPIHAGAYPESASRCSEFGILLRISQDVAKSIEWLLTGDV